MSEALQETETELTLQLSPDDAQLLLDVIQRSLQVATSHSQTRISFLEIEKEFNKIEEKFKEEENILLAKLKLLAQEQQLTLTQLGKRMKIPDGYRLNIETMTWETSQDLQE